MRSQISRQERIAASQPHSVLQWSRRELLKNTLRAGAGAMTAAAIGAHSTSAVAQDLSGKIVVWAWPGATGVLKETLPGFNAKYPHITVEIKTLGFNDVHTKLLAAVSSGRGAPDVCGIEDRRVVKFGLTGGLEDLTTKFEPHRSAIMPFKLSFCTDRDGKVWGLPWDASPTGTFYHVGRFEEAGITPKDIATWDGYLAAGKEILGKSGGKVKMLALQPSEARALYEPIAIQLGAGIFDVSYKLNIESEPFIKAAEIAQQIMVSGISANVPEYDKAWLEGFNTASWATSPYAVWMGGTIRDNAPNQAGKWTVARWPSVTPDGPYAAQGRDFGSALAIPSQSKNKELAWAFIEHAQLTAAGQLIQYTKGDLFPSMITPEVLNAPIFKEPDPYFHNDPIREVFADSNAKLNVTIAVHPEYAQAQDIIARYLTEPFKGNGTVQEALKSAAEETRNKLKIE